MAATILIVDDSKMFLQILREALEQDQHRVLEAGNGKEALAILEKENPELVITDINMPEMDGLALIQEVRKLPQHQYTPILVVSTEGSDGMKKRGREHGATGWLVKPFHPEQLRETARCALSLREKTMSRFQVRNPSPEKVNPLS